MDGHRIETTVVKEGELILEGLPFHVGDRVEVVIVAKRDAAGEEMLISIGHAVSVIPDVPRRNAAIERLAGRRAGPPHRAARNVAYLVEHYRFASAAAGRNRPTQSEGQSRRAWWTWMISSCSSPMR